MILRFENEDLREIFEERSAIREYEGGEPRQQAEAEALAELLFGYPWPSLEAHQIDNTGSSRNTFVPTD